jgi:lycopene beta-cyclase
MLNYDYIILGTGAAGLSLVMRMINSENFNNKRILLIDKEPKNKNDRTWCFWENKSGFFEDIVYHKWDRLSFYGNEFSADLNIRPYQYKMIRGVDFYAYCFDKIASHSNIDIIYGEVRSVLSEESHITIHLDNQELNCAPSTIFNSIYRPSNISHGSLQLLQHFKGWIIDCPNALFDPRHATLMDFRVHQRYGTSFMYVLPTSPSRALVEYTLFTPKTLKTGQYDTEIHDYVHSVLKQKNFTISEEEFGIIPMTNARFTFFENGMYNIGMAGGQTKPSTGYTFQFIQKQSDLIVDCLNSNNPLSGIPGTAKRFHFYDSVLLRLLVSNRLSGEQIFTRMFQRNKTSQIFKFLDNETSLVEELRLISTLQTMPFFKAAMRV